MRGPCRTCDHWRRPPGYELPDNDEIKKLPSEVQENIGKMCTRNSPNVRMAKVQGPLHGQVATIMELVNPQTPPDYECGCWEPEGGCGIREPIEIHAKVTGSNEQFQ